MRKKISAFFSDPGRRFGVVMVLLTAMLAAIMAVRTGWLLFRTTEVFYWKVFYQRGLPLVIAGSLLCLSITAGILIRSRESLCKTLREDRKKIFCIGILLLIGLVLGLTVNRTRLGLEKENAFWGKPTVPLLEWHILLAFALCLLCFCLTKASGRKLPSKISFLIPLLIWLCAVTVWTAIPNQNGFFSPAGRAPNYETYPFSDGSFYGHYARAAAAGMGLKGDDIPPRPLYIAFLTGLHLLSDNAYDRIIFLQTLVLGLLPVFVYLCGRDLHSVESGLGAALLVILRETHAILSAPFGHNVSTTKYFFADLPTALVCAALIWLLIRWQKAALEKAGLRWAFAAGCALGAMVLIRTQSFCLLFLLFFPLIPALRKNFRQGILQALLFALALGICVAPWLLRSYRITGQFVFDHPMTQTAEMARSYNFDGADLSRLPGENDGDYTQRMTAFIADSMKKHFSTVAGFVTTHFLNSGISNFRLFPLRDHLNDPGELLKSTEPFWETLDSGDLEGYNLIFFGLGFLIWAVGVGGSRQCSLSAGMIPFLAITVFNFSTALGRYSAGRYLIPTDWIMMLYFAIGMAELIAFFWKVCGGVDENRTAVSGKGPSFAVTAVFLILIAAAIPAADQLIPQHFEQDSAAAAAEMTGPLQMECPEKDRLYLHAIAVYPRYYAAGEGEPESAKQGYAAVDHGRLVFLTLAPENFGTIEMAMDNPPDFLPDGAEVWFSACQNGPTSVAETLLIRKDGILIRYPAEP